MLLIQDNAPIHTAQVAVAEAANCGFELLPLPFTHQTSSCFFNSNLTCMFTILETMIRSCAVEEFLEDQDATFFCDEICWTKCIAVKGEYIEK